MTSLFEAAEYGSDVVMLEFAEWRDSPATGEECATKAADEVDEAAAEQAERVAALEAQLSITSAQVEQRVRAEWEQRLHDAIETERTAVAMSCASFAKARGRYFADVESEVVKLALAISARVLQREVMMDTTLLAGVVRVALTKLSNVDGVVLEVPAEDSEAWRRAMKSSGVAVEPVARLQCGEVVLKSSAGVAELGIEAQLVEIERGFFDLLAKRPA